MMVQKERIFYLDFVRAFATVLIVLTHYNALFLYSVSQPNPKKAIITAYIGNVYIGDIGVALFLIISGAAFTHVYDGNKIKLLPFYKKRLLSIYPIYWIAYVLAFLTTFYINGSIQEGIPKKNIIFSVLGIDTFLANYGVRTFALVGEWFIALILVIYILYPGMKLVFEKKPVLFAGIVSVGYILSIIFIKKHVDPLRWLLLFAFGMFFYKYIKKVDWKIAVVCIIMIFGNSMINATYAQDFREMCVGISIFFILVFVSNYLNKIFVRRICSIICKYSYACFIVHHTIIYMVVRKFDLDNISMQDNICLFGVCCIVIIVISKLIYDINENVLGIFKVDKIFQ